MGTCLRVLSESFPTNTNTTRCRWFFKNLCVIVLWMKLASAQEGLNIRTHRLTGQDIIGSGGAAAIMGLEVNCYNLSSIFTQLLARCGS